jgi:predicted alpha/beta superfamily hydrolase
MKKIILIALVILLLFGCTKSNVITLGHEITIGSTALGEDRVMSIYLPDSYENSQDNYPVLYMLDGEAHFIHGCGAVNYMSSQGVIPEMIVVAIQNVDRNRDFSPVHVDNIPTSGGADKFLEFVGDELLPYINDHYRTSSYDVIMGHSFGGVFITYALLERPDLFDAFVSISPFMQFADNYIVTQTEEKLLDSFDNDVSYYLCVGEEPAYYEAIEAFIAILDERADPKFHYDFENFFLDEDHNTMPYIGLVKGLRYVFKEWSIPVDVVWEGMRAVDNYYAKLSSKYGITVKATEALINQIGYLFLQNGDIEEAIITFKENITRHPDSPNVYDSLGEAYETNGQFELAKENYKKAYDLGVEQKSPQVPIFKTNYERLK